MARILSGGIGEKVTTTRILSSTMNGKYDGVDEVKFLRSWAYYWHDFSKEAFARLAKLGTRNKEIESPKTRLRRLHHGCIGSRIAVHDIFTPTEDSGQQTTIDALVKRVEDLEGICTKNTMADQQKAIGALVKRVWSSRGQQVDNLHDTNLQPALTKQQKIIRGLEERLEDLEDETTSQTLAEQQTDIGALKERLEYLEVNSTSNTLAAKQQTAIDTLAKRVEQLETFIKKFSAFASAASTIELAITAGDADAR
ncbi:hypothetical protein QC761_0109720 [Podospora bellae-mahoneyi]|uniref:Uncharacterized protein n=1 Tax=Podospora bellae-mahoneyi TaxID=2093777 RepID=A0ABR0F6F6_9PEZI|nr:hypothetical protein QC761_0109720 [Podospora bellae-mahoneyi]